MMKIEWKKLMCVMKEKWKSSMSEINHGHLIVKCGVSKECVVCMKINGVKKEILNETNK